MKKYWSLGAAALLALTLAACGSGEEAEETNTETEAVEKKDNAAEKAVDTEKVISYLGTDYTLPNPTENIVAASLEAMEDAVALGVKPVGVLEVAGEIPEYLATELDGAALIGDKMKPNAEAILNLDPDVIIGTSKWNEDMMAQMNKMATTIPYSHISENWKDNLLAFGQLADKEAEAEKIIADYEEKAADAKEKLGETVADKEVLVIRVRAGVMNIYPAGIYLNPVLYEDLGLQAPEVLGEAKAQAELTLETLAEIDPDVIFMQYETSENADTPNVLEDLQANPIFKSLTANKNGEVYVNAINPLAQGGTAWSKTKFLDAAVEKLVK